VTPLTPAGTPSARPDGMLLAPTLTGSAGATIGFRGGAVLSLTGDLQASPQRLGLRPGSVTREQAAADGDLEARIDIAPPEPVLLGGAADGSRFELARAHLSLAATGTGLGLVLDLSGADSFVRGLLGDARYELPVALLIQWSSDEGLRFSGSALPAITIPVGLLLGGVLSVSEIQLALGSGQADGAAELAVTATGSVLLGPFSVSFDRLGALAEASIARRRSARLQAARRPRPGHRHRRRQRRRLPCHRRRGRHLPGHHRPPDRRRRRQRGHDRGHWRGRPGRLVDAVRPLHRPTEHPARLRIHAAGRRRAGGR
jgi:hypothetical protein